MSAKGVNLLQPIGAWEKYPSKPGTTIEVFLSTPRHLVIREPGQTRLRLIPLRSYADKLRGSVWDAKLFTAQYLTDPMAWVVLAAPAGVQKAKVD